MDDVLDREKDWNNILDAFSQKVKKLDEKNEIKFSIPFIIRCMLSFKLVDVGDINEFWSPLVDILCTSLQ